VQEVALRVTPRVDPSALVGRIAVTEVLAPDPVGSLLFAHHNSSWQLGFEHERELQAVTAARFVEQLVGERDASHVVLGATDPRVFGLLSPRNLCGSQPSTPARGGWD
jgi:hypothetical protein